MMDDKGTKSSLLNTLNGGRGRRGDGGGFEGDIWRIDLDGNIFKS